MEIGPRNKVDEQLSIPQVCHFFGHMLFCGWYYLYNACTVLFCVSAGEDWKIIKQFIFVLPSNIGILYTQELECITTFIFRYTMTCNW